MENSTDCIVKSTTNKNHEMIGYGAIMKWGGAVLPLLLLVVVLFFVYRYIKNINKRFSSIEEILGKVIEKNNQMQHLIQSSMRYPQVPVAMSSSQSQSLPTQCPMVVHPPQPPVVVAPPPPNLDREIMEELLELDSPPPPPPSTPVKKAEPKKKVVVEEEIVEGRVDEEVEVDVATTTTSE